MRVKDRKQWVHNSLLGSGLMLLGITVTGFLMRFRYSLLDKSTVCSSAPTPNSCNGDDNKVNQLFLSSISVLENMCMTGAPGDCIFCKLISKSMPSRIEGGSREL